MLQRGDKIGLVASSNGMPKEMKEKVEKLIKTLEALGLQSICSPYLYAKQGVYSGTGKERAKALMQLYEEDSVKMICDLSGGEIANEVLSELDFNRIKKHPKPFWGYSDLTTIINAIYTQTGQMGYLYQIRNLVGECSKEQIDRFKASVLEEKKDLYDVHFEKVNGGSMSGILIGGNIRCFLKLAGTPYMPDFKDKVLFLEAMGGEVPQMVTYLNQLKQIGAFKAVNGILLGTFTAMEREKCEPNIETLVKNVVEDPSLPIARTREVGHSVDAKCIRIGSQFTLNN